jgi:signal transduction histidine kinase
MTARPKMQLFIPAAIFTVMTSLTLLVWRQQVGYQDDLLLNHTGDVCAQAARRLKVFMESHLRLASIFAKRWSTHESRDFSRQRFEGFASIIVGAFPGLHAMELFPAGFRSGWSVPRGVQIPKSIDEHERQRMQEQALASNRAVLSAPFSSGPGGTSLYAILALKRQDELLGFLQVDFLAETLINDCFHTRIRSEFHFMVQDEDEVLFRSEPNVGIREFNNARVRASEKFSVENRTWKLTMAPKTATSPGSGWTESLPVLLLGIILSLGLGWLAYMLLQRMEMFRLARDQQARLSRKVLMAQEQERSRVSRELHDELGQLLTALRLEMGWLEKKISASQVDESGVFKNAIVLVEQATEELRRMCKGLRPPLLDDLGLEPAVNLLVEDIRGWADMEVELDCSLDEQRVFISKDVALCTYRIMQESITNVSRHSGAKKMSIRLQAKPDELSLTVSDDGVGFDIDRIGALQGCGLEGMRERANLVGGTIEISSVAGKGTRIRLRVPLKGPGKEDAP